MRYDITTTGRTSGEPRQIEIVFSLFDGDVYLRGIPDAWVASAPLAKVTFLENE